MTGKTLQNDYKTAHYSPKLFKDLTVSIKFVLAPQPIKIVEGTKQATIAVRDKMFLGMQGFDSCLNLIKFIQFFFKLA